MILKVFPACRCYVSGHRKMYELIFNIYSMVVYIYGIEYSLQSPAELPTVTHYCITGPLFGNVFSASQNSLRHLETCIN